MRLARADLPRLKEIELDGAVLLFTAGIVLLSSVFFGIVPALAKRPVRAYCARSRGIAA